MDRETYKELQSLSDEFEESVKRPVGNARQYSENDLFCTEISENDSDHDQNNQNLEYQDRSHDAYATNLCFVCIKL